MLNFPLLSIIIFLPLLGGFLALATGNRWPLLCRWISLTTTLLEFSLVALYLISGVTAPDRAYGGLAAGGELLLDPQPGGQLQSGAGWDKPTAPAAHGLYQHHLYPGFLARHYGQDRLLPFLSALFGIQRHGPVHGHRPHALLSLLGNPDHSHVLSGGPLGP